jgi:hypothetical protein
MQGMCMTMTVDRRSVYIRGCIVADRRVKALIKVVAQVGGLLTYTQQYGMDQLWRLQY